MSDQPLVTTPVDPVPEVPAPAPITIDDLAEALDRLAGEVAWIKQQLLSRQMIEP